MGASTPAREPLSNIFMLKPGRKQKRECQGDAMPVPKAGKSAGPGQLHLHLWNNLTGDGNMFNSEKLTNARTPIVSTSNIYGQA